MLQLTMKDAQKETRKQIAELRTNIYQRKQELVDGRTARKLAQINFILAELQETGLASCVQCTWGQYRASAIVQDCNDAVKIAAHFEALGWPIELDPEEAEKLYYYTADLSFDGRSFIDLRLRKRSCFEEANCFYIYLRLKSIDEGTCSVKYEEETVITKEKVKRAILVC